MASEITMSEFCLSLSGYIKQLLKIYTYRTEAIEGAAPVAANSPQKCPYGLYAEKFSGTAFTVPRNGNQQSWLYRILPASSHAAFTPVESNNGPDPLAKSNFKQIPNQLRWDPFDLNESVDWINSLN